MNSPFAGIICPQHGHIDIDYLEYSKQMDWPNVRWKCPLCGQVAEFDDGRYEELNPEPQDD